MREFKEPAEAPTRGWGAGGGGGSTRGETNELVPFDVTLSLDKTSYAVGEELTYGIVLRSRSPERIIVPWQPDWRPVEKGHERAPPGYVSAVIGLTLHRHGDKKEFILQAIQGSLLVEGSRHSVEPGEKVRILGRFTWTAEILAPFLDSTSEEASAFEVSAWFQYLYPPDTRFDYRPSQSAESVLVQLRRAPD